MRSRLAGLFVAVLAVVAIARCSSPQKANTCVPGQSAGCVGAGACAGNQVCNAAGTFGACICAATDGGGTDAGSGADSGSGLDSGASDAGDGGASDAGLCAAYTSSTVAAMRTAGANGCFQLDNVISIGLTPGTSAPRLFVQDTGGGDFSAMLTQCTASSVTHPCHVAAAVATIVDGRSVTVTGSYVKSSVSQLESFYIDSIVDNGAGTMPTQAIATVAQIARSGTSYNLAFQHVAVSLSGPDQLVMYDWTPSEFVITGATTCPYQTGGFGMIPTSVVATPGSACTNGTSQPAGQATPNAAEVLIGRDFYNGFTTSSDCRCAKMYSDNEPSAPSTLTGSIGGMLVFDAPFGAATGYFYLAPKLVVDAPVTNTVAGM